jgi:tetratricopeptide (TPR) repeat protein
MNLAGKTRRAALLCLLLACGATGLGAQNVDLNTYYAYPISFGVGFENLSPWGAQLEYSLYYGITGVLRVPLGKLPILQPIVRFGLNSFVTPQVSTTDPVHPNKLENTQLFLMPGIGWSSRLAKNFEVGVDLSAGYEMIIFPNIDVLSAQPQPRRTDNLLATLGARVTFNPSYSLSIDVTPAVTARYALSPLTDFNGITFGIGVTGNYRFGEDPDAPKAAVRSISFGEAKFPPLYAAMQSYYAKNAFAKVTIRNVEKFSITDVQVTFYQAGYMDTPTALMTIPSLAAGATVEVPVVASFNSEVFLTNGDTPLNGEIVAEYTSRNRPAKQPLPVSYVLYDRTSISWDDDRKEAAFITKADTALRNYATFVRQAVKDRVVPGFSEPLQTATAIYYALKELGVIYQLALTSSFAQAHANPLVVDHVHLPRETLQRKAGDCSDLTALYCALLESVGIPTGFITVPGHIYPVFGTKVATASYRDLHPDKNMTFDVNGELWIPVEMTMVGTSDFQTAWRTGVDEWRALESDPKRRAIFFTSQAQDVFHPVGLKEEDLGLQYGDAKKIADNFRDAADRAVSTVIDAYAKVAVDSSAKSDYNRLGIVAAQYGRYDQALSALNTALSLDRNYLSAQINLGNVYYLQQDYQSALKVFHGAEEAMQADGNEKSALFARVVLNISRSYYEIEDYAQAATYYDRAAAIAPDLVGQYGYLKSGQGDSGSRAAEQGGPGILYAEGEE